MTAPECADAGPGSRLSAPFLGAWQLNIDTPIGARRTTLELRDDGLRTEGTIVDLFGSLLAIEGLRGEGDEATWRLELHLPLRITLHFRLKLANGELSGYVDARDIQMPCTGRR